MKRAMDYRVLALMLGAGLAFPDATFAQGRLALEVAAGPSTYDLSGTGTGPAGGAFLAWRPMRGLVLEPGIGVFHYKSQFGNGRTHLFPELSIQGELLLGTFRPFLGGGAGATVGLTGDGMSALTLHAVGGARVDLSPSWGFLGQLRLRAVRPWTGHTADFLFGVSRSLQSQTGGMVPGPAADPGYRPMTPPARMELTGHLGVHVDRADEVDRALIGQTSTMYATPGEASAFNARLGYWLRPALGVQLAASHSSNESWQGSTSFPVQSFANRTTYLSARGVARTSPMRRAQLFAAAGPALMLYGGTGENLRTSDANLGGVLELGARLRMTQWLGAELALSNYFYGSRYRDGESVFRHDLLILPGLVFSWQ